MKKVIRSGNSGGPCQELSLTNEAIVPNKATKMVPDNAKLARGFVMEPMGASPQARMQSQPIPQVATRYAISEPKEGPLTEILHSLVIAWTSWYKNIPLR
jgi:hypothetical protein